MVHNCLIILFGATGDLTKRKIIPSLYLLMLEKKLENIALLAVALNESNVENVFESARPFVNPKEEFDESLWEKLKKRTSCVWGDIREYEVIEKVKTVALHLEKHYALSGNRLAYLAVPATSFVDITNALGAYKIMEKQGEKKTPWHRIVYEKPFGQDLSTAHEINTAIAQWFSENQIYRIDHYLTKEVVSNIALIRFTNCVFEPLWNNRYIDQVHIVLAEEEGIENRGSYYDRFGALSDVVQNHMLQLLALVGMETPTLLSGDYVRARRAEVLNAVQFVDGILGQYDNYLSESKVVPYSTTETFAYLYMRIQNPRWAGVPFFLKTGKYLKKQEIAIHIKFKKVDCILTKQSPSESNWLTIKVNPDATFYLTLNAKKPGYSVELMPVAMEFCHSCVFGSHIPSAYEILFEDVMRGEQASAVRFDEIESAWNIIQQIKDKKLPLYRYDRGSDGPQELHTFMYHHGARTRP